MNVVTPSLLPGARELFNALYPTNEPKFLTDDLYAAEFPGKVFVSVGWYPEHDPTGEYEVCLHGERYEDLRADPVKTRDLAEVVSTIERLGRVCMGSTETAFASGSINTHMGCFEFGRPVVVNVASSNYARFVVLDKSHA